LTNERWLKWAIARYYRSIGCKVSMKPARAGNAVVDGVAVTPEGERIAIEVKSPRDDIIRGVGQCAEALAAGYSRVVLVTTLRVAKKRVFQRRRFKLLGVDPKARIHRLVEKDEDRGSQARQNRLGTSTGGFGARGRISIDCVARQSHTCHRTCFRAVFSLRIDGKTQPMRCLEPPLFSPLRRQSSTRCQ
jgi:hypothetical protein